MSAIPDSEAPVTPIQPEKHLWEYDHPYYTSECNYYSRDCTYRYETWQDFLSEMGEADDDYNTVIRWDWSLPDPSDYGEGEELPAPGGQLQVTYVMQRKGIYAVSIIEAMTPEDEPSVLAFLTRQAQNMRARWAPLLP